MFAGWKTGLWRNPVDIRLDDQNPRLTGSAAGASQPAVIEAMLETQGDNIRSLARKISVKGYIPIDPIVVVEIDGVEVVVEGNCRITACKLLLNPDLAPKNHKAFFKAKASGISSDVEESIKKIPVVVVPTKEDARVYIEQRHTGNSIIQWNGYAQGRFYAKDIEAGESIDSLMEIYDRTRSEIQEAIRTYRVGEILTSANWQEPYASQVNLSMKSVSETANAIIRLLDFADAKVRLGLNWSVSENGKISSNLDEDSLERLVVSLGAEHNFLKGDDKKPFLTTRTVNSKGDAQKYLDGFEARGGTGRVFVTPKAKPSATKKVIKQSPPKPPVTDDKWLFPRDVEINTNSPKLKELFLDGTRIQWAKTPYAAALLLRATLECILREQLKKHGKWQYVIKGKEGGRVGILALLDAAKTYKEIFEDDDLYTSFKHDSGEIKNRAKSTMDFVQHASTHLLDKQDLEYLRKKLIYIIKHFVEYGGK